jgi:hypothetical protein
MFRGLRDEPMSEIQRCGGCNPLSGRDEISRCAWPKYPRGAHTSLACCAPTITTPPLGRMGAPLFSLSAGLLSEIFSAVISCCSALCPMLMSSIKSGWSLARSEMKSRISGSGWYAEWKVEVENVVFQVVVRLTARVDWRPSIGKSSKGNIMGDRVEFEGK